MRASSAAASTEPAQQARTMGRDALSVALIDARNTSLRWLACFEDQGFLLGAAQAASGSTNFVPLYAAGRAGWLQEWWITRNLQRLRGEASGHDSLRLAALDPRMDEAFGADDGQLRQMASVPSAADTRSYLEATLEQTLELLSNCPAEDTALHVYRCALQSEDRLAEAFAVAAQAMGVAPVGADSGQGLPPSRPTQDAIWLPAQRVLVGAAPGGWVPVHERWAHEVSLPELEIDAQAVTWERYAEFVEDGAYDRPELWQPSSWEWVVQSGRRAPRYVEQMRLGVLAHRFGKLQRAAGRQAACHLSWHEADAWCRWAGRRLPTEVEWEAAAVGAAARGFVWGDVWEWAAGTARAWPEGPVPAQTQTPRRALRGASSWTVPRVAHARQRRFVQAERDELFSGFRSCAL